MVKFPSIINIYSLRFCTVYILQELGFRVVVFMYGVIIVGVVLMLNIF